MIVELQGILQPCLMRRSSARASSGSVVCHQHSHQAFHAPRKPLPFAPPQRPAFPSICQKPCEGQTSLIVLKMRAILVCTSNSTRLSTLPEAPPHPHPLSVLHGPVAVSTLMSVVLQGTLRPDS